MSTPRLPNVGEFVRGVGKLVKTEIIPPPPQPPPETDYIFEENTAETHLRINSRVISCLSCINDFYGENTCVREAIKEAKAYVKRMEIKDDSDSEVTVTKVVTQIRKRPKDRENFYDKEFTSFDAKARGSEWNVSPPVRTIVWSSKKSSSQSSAQEDAGRPSTNSPPNSSTQ